MAAARRTITPALVACSIFLVSILSSCADKIKTDIIAFEALDESLVNSNVILDNQSKTILASLEDRLADPVTAEKAKVWYPRAQQIQAYSKEMYAYIEELKADLKKQAGLKINDGVESFKENDKNAVMRLFEKNEKGKELYDRLTNYKKKVLNVDPQLNEAFSNTLLLTTRSFESSKNQQADFTKTFFDDITTMAALALLSKFRNNVSIVENKTLDFCHTKTARDVFIHYWYTSLVSQDIRYAKAGESIEITAGIGSFVSFKTEVSVNGKKVPVGNNGVAIYKLPVAGKPGKYVVPVEVSFTDDEGRQQTITKNIEYTVADENKQ